jgi:hypothetical protein
LAYSAAERLEELRHGLRRIMDALDKDDIAEAKWLLTVLGTLLEGALEAELQKSHPSLPSAGHSTAGTDSAG